MHSNAADVVPGTARDCEVDAVQAQIDHHMLCSSPNRGAAQNDNNDDRCRKS